MTTFPLPAQHTPGVIPFLGEALHELAQPLTALLFILELGQQQGDTDNLRQSLSAAAEECLRAVDAMRAVQTAASQLGQGGVQ